MLLCMLRDVARGVSQKANNGPCAQFDGSNRTEVGPIRNIPRKAYLLSDYVFPRKYLCGLVPCFLSSVGIACIDSC